MGSSTIIQDIISPSFTLPDGATINDIYVYAPKLTSVTGTEGNYNYTFDVITANENGTLTLENGVVTGGYENRLNSSNVVTIGGSDGKTLQITGFNFKEHYCHPIIVNNEINGCAGRKLVIKFYIQIEEGVWGDGIQTNGEMSVILPNGTQSPIHFDCPVTNVLGDVWTEIVTSEPQGFDPQNIDSPEDLAWFISRVNGRINYADNNTIASDPTLSGKLTADIDMSAHNWVPIGCGYKCNNNNQFVDEVGDVVDTPTVKLAYEGVFDGNGYVITGLKNNASKYYKQTTGGQSQVVVFPGMFANVKGNGETTGVVKNVFVLDADFRGKHHNSGFVHHGIIADTLTGGAIYNCEAVGRITCNNDEPDEDMKLIYGGLVGLNDGGTIHSSMAMATLTAYSMGGMVGEMKHNAKLENSFTNGVFNYLGDNANWNNQIDNNGYFRYVGGLVGRNHGVDKVDENYIESYGSINNCYVRLERPQNYGTQTGTNAIQFGQLVGTNVGSDTESGTINNCYVPGNVPTPVSVAAIADQTTTFPLYSVTYAPSLMRQGRGNDNMVGGAWTNGIIIGGTPMLILLNQNVGEGQSSWKRTTAGGYSTSPNGGNINGDYPILKFTDFNCVASTDGIALDYALNLDQMLERHNNGNMNVNSSTYSMEQAAAIYGGTINLYKKDDTSKGTSTEAGTMVYIDENVSLLQSTSAEIDAYTCQTMKSFSDPVTYDPNTGWNNTNLYTPDGQRWHLVSSSLKGSKFGWKYGNENQYANIQYPFSWEENPCTFWLESGNDDAAVFPTDAASYMPVDFYCFFEKQYHWINFKRNSLSHWHMDYSGEDIPANHVNIEYSNEDEFTRGKGYLLAIYPQYFQDHHMWSGDDEAKNEQFLQNRGTLNNGDITIPVTYTEANEWSGLSGYNLLGNPYQSYLDFTAFAWENSSLWDDESKMTYGIYDPELDEYVQGTAGEQPSRGALAATGDINMHQGFFIRVNKSTGGNGEAKFTNAMRSNEPAAGTHFRGSRASYPLINFILNDEDGNDNIAVLEVGRPTYGGAQKLRLGSCKGRISLRHDNEDYGILFSEMTEGSQPLWFRAEENGIYTLSWNTANANFQELTLVDNITGVTVDMLTHDSYRFEGLVDQYRSRFKVVIGKFTGIEEQEDGASTGSATFAFFDGSEWVVNGQGSLDVVDVMGRTVYSSQLTDSQSRVNLNSLAQGVYVLRMASGNELKTQKIIIQ